MLHSDPLQGVDGVGPGSSLTGLYLVDAGTDVAFFLAIILDAEALGVRAACLCLNGHVAKACLDFTVFVRVGIEYAVSQVIGIERNDAHFGF